MHGSLSSNALVRAYHVGDDLDEPADLVFYCSECAEREFGPD
jgi:hypothetical protein